MRLSSVCLKYFKEAGRQSRGGSAWRKPQSGYNSRFGTSRGDNRGFRNDNDDRELLERTRGGSRVRFGDGLMGKPGYDIDHDAVRNMKWTDLIPQGDSAPKPEMAGVSPVPTQELANRRLLSLPLVNSLVHNRNYEWLTPVQAQTLLPILRDESVVVRAKTGTGKTAAFAIPILQKVLEAKAAAKDDVTKQNKVSALVVSPTRELAQQIADEIFKITQFGGLSHIKVQSLVGGVAKPMQLQAAGLAPGNRGRTSKVADIIVATPGRLRDVLDEPGVAEKFSDLHARVYDEADRILDIGFEREMEEIKDIIDEVSTKDDVPLLLFSATADRTMRDFARRQYGDRVRVVDTVPKNEPTANELVEQYAVSGSNWADVYEAASREMLNSQRHAEETGTNFKAVVFLPTTAMVDHYEQVLRNLFRKTPRSRETVLPVLGIHGGRKQQSRQNRSDQFRKANNAILITTDVVARGMDFPQVTHVFQLGPPPDVASYVHRIGRTARIGNSGKSYLYYPKHVRGYIDALARENIKPELSIYTSDPEFRDQFALPFERGTADSEEAEELVRSLMSYMSVLKSKYSMNANEFLRDMEPFVHLLGLEKLKLAGSQQQAWLGGKKFSGNRKRKFGSSRNGRMRW